MLNKSEHPPTSLLASPMSLFIPLRRGKLYQVLLNEEVQLTSLFLGEQNPSPDRDCPL